MDSVCLQKHYIHTGTSLPVTLRHRGAANHRRGVGRLLVMEQQRTIARWQKCGVWLLKRKADFCPFKASRYVDRSRLQPSCGEATNYSLRPRHTSHSLVPGWRRCFHWGKEFMHHVLWLELWHDPGPPGQVTSQVFVFTVWVFRAFPSKYFEVEGMMETEDALVLRAVWCLVILLYCRKKAIQLV